MIPTRSREKLPKGLSYPIGAEAIATGLVGAPHLDALELRFSARPIEPASRFRRAIADRLPYPIVEARHRPARRPGLSAAGFMIESGWYDEHWELTVYPVASGFRPVARRLLLGAGIPALSRWLLGSDSAACGGMIRRAALVFDPAEGKLLATGSSEHESSKV